MSFLAPLFFLGLAALAVPIVIHLIQRERKQVVEFPSLMFLRRIPYQSMRRRRIRHWALLLLRLAALTLIVASFARPFLDRPGLDLTASTGARELVILLDRSYSVGYGDRWERARAAAKQAVDGLGPGDRVTLIQFAVGADVVVRSAADRSLVLGAIETSRVGPEGTRYGPALRLAQSILAESSLPRREAVLISDFQKVGWDRSESVRFPPGATLTPVPVADANPSNVAVSALNLQRSAFAGQDRVAVAAGLTNRSDSAVDDLAVTLEIDGREVQTGRVRIAPNGSATAAFSPIVLTARDMRGTVSIPPDRLLQDNALYFVMSPSEPVNVLIVERAPAGHESSLYLRSALAIGGAPRFDVEAKPANRVTTADLDGRAVVVLNDVAPPGAITRRLLSFVDSGGGLLIALGERAAWPPDAAELLPGTPGARLDRTSGRGAVLSIVDFSHPALEIFKAPRSGDFAAARFFRYRALAPEPSARVLARFDDGAVALAEGRIGQGRVMVWTSTLDTFWNDLALKPVFLPLVHRVLAYLAGYTEPAPWYSVGQAVSVAAANTDRVALAPRGRPIALPGGKPAVLELAEPGFYKIRPPAAAAERPQAIAVNVSVAESDLSPVDPQELVAAVTARPGSEPRPTGPVTLSPEEQERRQAVWWYLLLGGMLLLATDTMISNRLSRGTA